MSIIEFNGVSEVVINVANGDLEMFSLITTAHKCNCN